MQPQLLTQIEGVSDSEMADAIHPDDKTLITDPSEKSKKKPGRRILAAFKSVTKGGVETVLGTDRLKAAAGGEHAKNRLGVLKNGQVENAGPIDFPARYKGKKGHAYITASATSPALSWTAKEDLDPVFSIAIADIQVRPHSLRVVILLTKSRRSRRLVVLDGRQSWWSDGLRVARLQMAYSLLIRTAISTSLPRLHLERSYSIA